MARNDPQMNIRLPLDLKERIEAAAKAGNRSMNAEIVSRLERTFEVLIPFRIEGDAVPEAAEAFLARFAQDIVEQTLRATGQPNRKFNVQLVDEPDEENDQ